MFCTKCGKEIDDKAVVCVGCGAGVKNNNTLQSDAPSFGIALLSFFIPVVGLVLYLIYDGSQPLRAASAGKGALIGFLTSIALSVLFVVIYFVIIGAAIGAIIAY